MKILVCGKSGQLAQELAAADTFGWCQFIGRDDLDLANVETIAASIAMYEFDLLVNAAAYTAVDKAEEETDVAHRLNALAPQILAKVAADRNVPVVHVSTDYVFDGSDPTPYAPTAPTGPINVYGETKLAGENGVANSNPRHLILRTSWVYSNFGANFVKTMLRLAKDRDALSIVGDQYGSPTNAANLARAILIIAQEIAGADTNASFWGTHHFCDIGVTSWASFAKEIFAQATELGMLSAPPKITAIPAVDYPTPAKRPEYSVLDCTSFDASFAELRQPWQDSLRTVMTKLAKDVQQ
jgi:dTDP-4-dehydrorhamnose reductase